MLPQKEFTHRFKKRRVHKVKKTVLNVLEHGIFVDSMKWQSYLAVTMAIIGRGPCRA